MDFTQLRILQAVADYGSISLAAKHLHRVPSNLTTRLKQLEEELGVALLIREHPRVSLSAHGRQLLGYAQRILALEEQARRALAGEKPAGSLRLGSMECTAAVLLPVALARYHRQHPEVEMSLQTGTSAELYQGVLNGKLAAALVDGPVGYDTLSARAVFHDELVWITAKDAPRVRTPEDLAGCTVFTFRPGCSYRDRMENWFATAARRPHALREIHSYHAMLGCVASGAGAAIMPRSVIETLPGNDSVSCHRIVEEHARVTTWLVWRKEGGSPAIEALGDLLQQE